MGIRKLSKNLETEIDKSLAVVETINKFSSFHSQSV